MEEIKQKIATLESQLTGCFFDDLGIEEAIKYWNRQLIYLINSK